MPRAWDNGAKNFPLFYKRKVKSQYGWEDWRLFKGENNAKWHEDEKILLISLNVVYRNHFLERFSSLNQTDKLKTCLETDWGEHADKQKTLLLINCMVRLVCLKMWTRNDEECIEEHSIILLFITGTRALQVTKHQLGRVTGCRLDPTLRLKLNNDIDCW